MVVDFASVVSFGRKEDPSAAQGRIDPEEMSNFLRLNII
jgi:hypothetical protein